LHHALDNGTQTPYNPKYEVSNPHREIPLPHPWTGIDEPVRQGTQVLHPADHSATEEDGSDRKEEGGCMMDIENKLVVLNASKMRIEIRIRVLTRQLETLHRLQCRGEMV